MKIELIYADHCPNVVPARRNLRAALFQKGQPLEWFEWDQSAPAAPSHVRRYASPTILINGKDITDESENTGGGGCRLYIDEAGHYSGVPSAQAIVRALDLTQHPGASGY